jgi:hypothetical protein
MACHRFRKTIAMLLAVTAFAASAGQISDKTLDQQCPAFSSWEKAQHKPVSTKRVTKPTDPALRKQLLGMFKIDQDARDALIKAGIQKPDPKLAKRMLEVDAANLKKLKPIIASHGFPTPSMVGKDGVDAAFILVQHADSDPGFQAKVLPQLARLRKQGAVSGQDFAMLTDRVLRAQHKRQRYGTQFFNKHTHGVMVPEPMQDPAHVDARRARVGLPPLAVYACILSVYYKTPVSIHAPQSWVKHPQKSG